MNLRKFTAANTRECLRLMREALGPDAMIVSTRKTAQGVEIIGASAEDIAAAEQQAPVQATGVRKVLERARPPAPAAAVPPPAVAPSPALWEQADDEQVKLSPAARVLAQQDPDPVVRAAQPAAAARSSPIMPVQRPAPDVPQVIRSSRQPMPLAEPPPLRSAQNDAMRAAARLRQSWAEQEPAEQLEPMSEPSAPVAKADSSPSEPVRPAVTPASSAAGQLTSAAAGSLSQTEADLIRAMGLSVEAMQQEAAQAARMEPVADSTAPVMNEVRAMRQWLEQQMLALTWRDATQRNPLRRQLWRQLVDAGFTPMLARAIVSHLPDDYDETKSAAWLKEVLVRNLSCTPEGESLVDRGGVYALVGPTGVGKTTTTAKLAARCVVKYGARSLGLITTDQYRIGAVDQLRTFGRILGVEVYTARGAQDLETMLLSMSGRRLVLVDTVGMGQRDSRIPEQISALSVAGLQRVLVLPAGGHAEQCEDIVQAYTGSGLAGVIISKLDEAVRLGGVLDAVIRHKLTLQAMTTGQRVPEDIHAPNAALLVHRALRSPSSPLFALQDEEIEWSSTPLTSPGVTRTDQQSS
jgi:flagellar biosynthesis protein FlhF